MYGLNKICQYQLRGLNDKPNTMLEQIAQIISGEITALNPPIASEYVWGFHMIIATWKKPKTRDKPLNRALSKGACMFATFSARSLTVFIHHF